MDNQKKPLENQKLKPPNGYLRFSGLAFQIVFSIGLFLWAGYKLDEYLENKLPVLTIIFSMLGLGGALFKLYKSLNDN